MGQVGGPERIFQNMMAKINHTAMRPPVAVIVLLLLALSSSLPAATVNTAEDLTAVIALHGKPCGNVVSYNKVGENEFVALCATGDAYHVYVDARGRVNVEKEK